MKYLEIYFSDLIETAQNEVLRFYDYENEEDGNLEHSPLFVLHAEEESDSEF